MDNLIQTKDMVNKFVPLYAKGESLDIGAGTAKYRAVIEKHVMSYKTSDVKEGEGIDYIEDAKKLSFDDGSFDTIFCFQVLEHVDSPKKVVSEIYRCLNPGGSCIATAPFLVPEHSDPYDFFRYTKEGVKSLFESEGFKVKEVGSYGGVFTVCGEFVKFMFLNPYCKKEYGRIRRALFSRVIRACYFLDEKFHLGSKDFYANVYIVALK